MQRFFGSAVFEGAEVSDDDYDRLMEQRTREVWGINDTRDDEAGKIVAVEGWAEEEVTRIRYEEAAEIEAMKRWAEETITRIRGTIQAEIDKILSGVKIVPIYEVRGERTACEICTEKIGTIGTMETLKARDCVPPFHKDCRCWLEEIGYCVL